MVQALQSPKQENLTAAGNFREPLLSQHWNYGYIRVKASVLLARTGSLSDHPSKQQPRSTLLDETTALRHWAVPVDCTSLLHTVYLHYCCRSNARVREGAEDGAGAEPDGVRLGPSPAQPHTTMEPSDRGHRPLAFDKVDMVKLRLHKSPYIPKWVITPPLRYPFPRKEITP
ncbi:hypothetical protein J6590_051897 [Homalodisca vitripennis]|nr:hypothetical protein J6590_051897 [Homalodisca vitripennis]